MELQDFAKENKLTLKVHVREFEASNSPMKYYAIFDGIVIDSGPYTVTAVGNGVTADEAMTDYARELSEQRLIINPHTAKESKLQAPVLTHTTLPDFLVRV